MKILNVLAVLLALGVVGCYYDSVEELYPINESTIPCDTTAVTYSGSIEPLIASTCYTCHGKSTASLGGDINLDGYSNLHRYAVNGKLLGTVIHAPGFTPMPREANSLTRCDIAAIRIWIASGMPNN